MKRQHALIKTILIFTLVHMLIVQWPLVNQVLRMVDVTRTNGAYALLLIELIQFCLFAGILGLSALFSLTFMRVVAGLVLVVDVIKAKGKII